MIFVEDHAVNPLEVHWNFSPFVDPKKCYGGLYHGKPRPSHLYIRFICFYLFFVLHFLIQSESHHMIFIAPYFVVPCCYSTSAVEAQVSLRSVMMALRAVAWITLLPRLLAEVRGPENWSFPSLVLDNFHIQFLTL